MSHLIILGSSTKSPGEISPIRVVPAVLFCSSHNGSLDSSPALTASGTVDPAAGLQPLQLPDRFLHATGKRRPSERRFGMRCLKMLARLLLLGPLVASPAAMAQAEPLNFSDVRLAQLGSTWIPLFDNPGVVVTLNEDRIVSFFTHVAGTLPDGGTDTIRFTVQGPGQPTEVQSFPIPMFGTVLPPFTTGSSTVFPVTYTPQAWELIVELLNSSPDFTIPSGPNAGVQVDSYRYSFSTVSPVPEPGTMLLLASGLALAAARQRRRKDTTTTIRKAI